MIFINELDDSVKRLVLNIAELKLVYDGVRDDELYEILENVENEKIVNVIGELNDFVVNDIGKIIEDAINWNHVTGME